jgi:hypothetical protein
MEIIAYSQHRKKAGDFVPSISLADVASTKNGVRP